MRPGLCQLETFENGAISAKSKQGDTRTGRRSQETNTIQTLYTNTIQTLYTNTLQTQHTNTIPGKIQIQI